MKYTNYKNLELIRLRRVPPPPALQRSLSMIRNGQDNYPRAVIAQCKDGKQFSYRENSMWGKESMQAADGGKRKGSMASGYHLIMEAGLK